MEAAPALAFSPFPGHSKTYLELDEHWPTEYLLNGMMVFLKPLLQSRTN